MSTLIFKYSKALQDCEDTFEAYHLLCKAIEHDKYYAEAYRNLLWLIHYHFFPQGLKNPCFVLDTILRHYVMSFYEYRSRKEDLFSDCCCDRSFFENVINQYIDYEDVLSDDDDIENLLPSWELEEAILFDYYLFEDDFSCCQQFNSSTEEMEELFKYAIGDNDDL